MMRTKKNGEPAIPKLVWEIKAGAHRRFSEELTRLLSAHESESETPLALALRDMIEKHNGLALVCNESREETRKGRPPRCVPIETSKNMLAVLRQFSKPSNKTGRPVAYGPRMDRFVYQHIEEIRAANAAKDAPKLTILSVIDQMNAALAREDRLDEKTYITANRNSVRSAYTRGKKLSET